MHGSSSDAAFPASLNQERVLLARELTRRRNGAEAAPSHLRLGLRLRGPLDVHALGKTLNEIVRRHAALRVAFFPNLQLPPAEWEQRFSRFRRTGVFEPGLFQQLVLQHQDISIQKIDLGESGQEAAIEATVRSEDRRPFDDGKFERMRASLLRLGDHDHVLVLVLDHLVSDLWCLPLIGREVRRLYACFADSDCSLPADPPLSFPEFAMREKLTAATGGFDRAVNYWRDQWARFGSARVSLGDLRNSSATPGAGSGAFPSVSLRFDESDSEKVRSLARNHRISLFTVFLAAFSVVLAKHTGRSVVAIWGHFANRTEPETRDMVGWLANSHILGVDLSDNPRGDALLGQVQRVVAGALSWQALPLSHLWRALRCGPRFAGITVLMDFNSLPRDLAEPRKSGGLEISPFILPQATTPRLSLLGVHVLDEGNRLSVTARFPKSKFKPESIAGLIEELKHVALKLALRSGARAFELAGIAPTSLGATREENEMDEFVVLDATLIPEAAEPCEESKDEPTIPAPFV